MQRAQILRELIATIETAIAMADQLEIGLVAIRLAEALDLATKELGPRNG
jgi:hypothetical protein